MPLHEHRPQDMPIRNNQSSEYKVDTQAAHPITTVNNTIQLNPFPWKNETDTHVFSPDEESVKSRVPILRLIPRPSSSNNKQSKMKLAASNRTHLDSATSDLAMFAASAFSTPTKTVIGDRQSIGNPSPIPSLVSTPMSMSPHSFLQTPPTFGVDLGVINTKGDDCFSSLQNEQFFFTPLETQDEWNYVRENIKSDFDTIHNDSFDYQIPDLIDPIHHEPASLWDTPSRLYLNGVCERIDAGSHTIHRETPVAFSSVKKLDDLTDNISGIYGFPIVLKQYDRDNSVNLTFPTIINPLKVKAPSISSSGSNSSSSPTLTSAVAPQNLKGDPQRMAKVKTELCIHYLNGTSCPFGDKCNYAHGEEELRYTRLCELQQAGLISDVKKYRTHPCLSWVSTGACPFGQRCVNLHDPCVEGSQPSWLPHSEIPGVNAETTLHIDVKYHRNMASLHQINPLVQDALWKERYASGSLAGLNQSKKVEGYPTSDWWETYVLVCNVGADKNSSSSGTLRNVGIKAPLKEPNLTQRKSLSELQRTCIAVLMSYNCQDASLSTHRNYMYNPRFLVFDKLCMILQTRYFVLVRNNEVKSFDNVDVLIRSVVYEISLEEYNGRRSPWDRRFPYTPKDVFIARELAFGPCGDFSADVSLWFELPASEIVACTQQQVKKHKRAQLKLTQPKATNSNEKENRPLAESSMSPSLDLSRSQPHKPFYHMQPIMDDDASYDLIRSILHHRIKSLLSRLLRGESFSRACQLLGEEESKLQDAYEGLKLHCDHWKWGVTSGRVQTTTETEVPPCCVKYKPVKSNVGTSLLWQSFAQNVSGAGNHLRECNSTQKQRLGVFEKLSTGESLTYGNRRMPHILSGKKDIHPTHRSETSVAAWKSILVNVENHNDWKIIMDQYKANTDATNAQVALGDKNMPLTPVVTDKKVMNTKL